MKNPGGRKGRNRTAAESDHTAYDSEELEDTMVGPAVNNEDMYKRDNDHTDAGVMENRRGPY
ncbi:hypothetical protein [Alteribacter natronophilus]|uniref:hypothetical protein n=1 Tax=Alteribacter natronophilus TaxID=2583810 RepID=UPI00110DC89A|nr:hypothetical protein [Alteribacter natronophilus]TMW73198.1 hypothetical protein FGB90_02495 [Alteribacter natronophilus]